jgi:hypothetical protein
MRDRPHTIRTTGTTPRERWLLAAFLPLTMLLCLPLWTSDRAYPTIPVFPGLPALPNGLSVLLSLGLALGAIAMAVWPSKRLAGTWVGLALVVVLFDINRLQPWLYQCILLYAILALLDDPGDAVRFLLVAMYVYSGLHKLNPAFQTAVFPWLFGTSLAPAWFLVPLLEAAVGVLLWVPQTRRFGVVGAVVMHLALLVILGPFGRNFNPVVWPWNVFMPMLACLMFWGERGTIWPAVFGSRPGKVLVVLAGILPLFGAFGWWDTSLSFALYSGRSKSGWIYLSSKGVAQLRAAYAVPDEALFREADGRYRLNLFAWSNATLNVPAYPETRVFESVRNRLIEKGIAREDIQLIVQ